MVENQLRVLSMLAHVDQEISEKEHKMIVSLGVVHGMSKEEIEKILADPEPLPPLDTLSNDEKYEYLYNLVQLMKIDGKVFMSEIEFCKDMAVRLGYKKKVIAELSSYIYSDPHITADKEALKDRIQKFMMK